MEETLRRRLGGCSVHHSFQTIPDLLYPTEQNDQKESDFRYQFAAQTASLSRRIHKQCGVGLEELHKLDRIYLVCLDKTEIISKVYEEQRELLDKVRVVLDMC